MLRRSPETLPEHQGISTLQQVLDEYNLDVSTQTDIPLADPTRSDLRRQVINKVDALLAEKGSLTEGELAELGLIPNFRIPSMGEIARCLQGVLHDDNLVARIQELEKTGVPQKIAIRSAFGEEKFYRARQYLQKDGFLGGSQEKTRASSPTLGR